MVHICLHSHHVSQMNELSEQYPHSDGNAHEAEPTGLQCGISVKGLTKVYKVSCEI